MKRYLIFLLLLTSVLLSCTQTKEEETRSTIFAGTLLSCDFGSAFPDADVADPPALQVTDNSILVQVVSRDGAYAKTVSYSLSEEREDASVIVGAPVPAAITEGARVTDLHILGDSGRCLQYESRYTEEEAFGRAFIILQHDSIQELTLNPAADLGYDLKYDNPRAGEIFRVTDALYVPGTDSGRYLLLTSEGLCCYDEGGTLLWSERGNLTRDIVLYENTVLAVRQKADEQTLHILDTDDGSRSDPIPITGEKTVFAPMGENGMLFSGGGHDLYTANETGIYALDFTAEDAAEDGGICSAVCSLFMDFALSDIYPDAVLGMAVTDADTAYLALADMTGTFGGPRLWRYKAIPQDALPQKDELVLAIFSAQNSYQLPVYHFNRTHADTRIVVRDYRVYEDEEERVMHFNADIMAGDIPDMVLLWQNSNYGTAISDYERSDLFADLAPLLSADPDFDYEGLLSYVTAPYTRYDGGQYLFPLQPGASGYFADPAVASHPLTVEGYLDLCEAHGAKPWQGMSLIAAAVDDFYDEETAACSFDGGRLESLLSRAEAMADNAGESPLIPLRMSHATLWDFVTRLQKAAGSALTDAGDTFPLVPVGYPTEDGALCVDFVSSEFFAVTTACAHPDAAVDFLQMLMDTNKTVNTPLDQLYWHRFDGGMGQTYYARDVMEELAFYEGKTLVYEDNAYFIYADDDPALADAVGTHFKITDAAADAFISYLDSIVRRVNYGSPAATIFREEYRAMADRPISERLKIIQSKVSLYLSEQFG